MLHMDILKQHALQAELFSSSPDLEKQNEVAQTIPQM